MTRELIDRNQITYMWQAFSDGKWTDGVTLQSIIERMPVIDAVEVVRCKDCKHYVYDEFDGAHVCIGLSKYVKQDFWCAYGERKVNAE